MRERDSFSLVDEETRERAVLEFPLTEGDVRTVGPQTLDDEFLWHGSSDDWYRIALAPEQFRLLDTPMYMAGGWFDFMNAGQLADWDALVERRNGRDLQLILGPWTHVMGLGDAHQYPFPEASNLVFDLGRQADFFDRYLRDVDSVIYDTPPVRWYDGGLGIWRQGDRIWPADAREVTWHAGEATGAVGCKPKGVLSPIAATRETMAFWTYDPHQPIHLNGGQLIDFSLWGMRYEIDWCVEPAAVFETDPLAASLEIAGSIAVDLRVASDAPDTVFLRGSTWSIRTASPTTSARARRCSVTAKGTLPRSLTCPASV